MAIKIAKQDAQILFWTVINIWIWSSIYFGW